MKRSEMIERISNQLKINDEKQFESISYELKAEMVLVIIEKAGMLPPRGEVDISNPTVLKDLLRTMPYLWEPEE